MNTQPWHIDKVPDQAGRVAIVTGAASGIGLETARVLAAKKAEVIIAVRNLTKGRAARQTILKDHPRADLQVMLLDLADLASVWTFASEFAKTYTRLDLLINNAGVMVPPLGRTRDGFELQMGTNHLGHFALTGRLLGLLQQTPASRVVTVSSMAHKLGKPEFSDLHWQRRRYGKWQAYGDSKIANLLFTFELGRRLPEAQPMAVAAHPGWSATSLQRHTPLTSAMNHLFAQDARMGALPSLSAALERDVAPGDYFGPAGWMEMKGEPVKVKSSERSRDADIAARLWQASEELTGVRYFPPAKE